LEQYFNDIMQYKYTANLEKLLDEIKAGKKDKLEVLTNFYNKFKEDLDKIDMKNVEDKMKDKTFIGVHPTIGHKIYASIGKHGPMLEMCDDNGKHCVKGPIKKPLTIKTLTMDDAVKVFEYPKKIGVLEKTKQVVDMYVGDTGPYLKIGNKYYSANEAKEEDIDMDYVNQLLEKLNANLIAELSDDKNTYVIRVGQYGPYVIVTPKSTKKGKGAKGVIYGLPEGEYKNIKIDDLKTLVDIAKLKKKNRFVKKTPDANKAEKKADDKTGGVKPRKPRTTKTIKTGESTKVPKTTRTKVAKKKE